MPGASASSWVVEITCPTLGINRSGLQPHDLLCPLLTSARSFLHLTVPVALTGNRADLPGYCASIVTLMPVGSTSLLPVQVWSFADFRLLTPSRRFVSASCLSGQRFDSGFLQHPRKPLPLAHFPLPVCRRLSALSGCALPGTLKKARRMAGALSTAAISAEALGNLFVAL